MTQTTEPNQRGRDEWPVEQNRLRNRALADLQAVRDWLGKCPEYLNDPNRPTFHQESLWAFEACLAPLDAALSRPADGDSLTVADYQECFKDHQRLVRELDVIWNGEDGAAKQASLCDMVGQIAKELPALRCPADGGVVLPFQYEMPPALTAQEYEKLALENYHELLKVCPALKGVPNKFDIFYMMGMMAQHKKDTIALTRAQQQQTKGVDVPALAKAVAEMPRPTSYPEMLQRFEALIRQHLSSEGGA